VDVTIEGDTCWSITVTAPGSDRSLAAATCTDAHHAIVTNLTPGVYKLCNTGCTTIAVTASPLRQSATIVEHPSDEEPTPSPSPAEDPSPSPSQDPEPEADPPAAGDEAASTED
jgi:hypothetical protein